MKKDVKERAEKFRDRVHHHMRNEGLDPENPKHRSEHYKRLRIDEKILGEILSGISRAFGNYITDDEAEMFLVKFDLFKVLFVLSLIEYKYFFVSIITSKR